MDKRTCYLCMPSYGSVCAGAARGFFRSSEKLAVSLNYDQGSLLATNFNAHWCLALNAALIQGKEVDYFAMLHADVQPQDHWLDVLIEEMERKELDVLSVIVPIKDPHGLTSTGIGGDDPWRPLCRLTMQEAYRLPETFTAADLGHADRPLLINTGCWACRFDKKWAKEIHFEINDRIIFDAQRGRYMAEVEPEDWNVSRQFHRLGLRVGATRKVAVAHRGEMNYVNTKPWGDYPHDREYTDKSLLSLQNQEHLGLNGWKFPADVDGWLSEQEGRELAKLASGKRVLEIGSYCGKSTICMAQTAEEIIAVDPFDGRATSRPRQTLPEFRSNLAKYGINGSVKPQIGTISDVGPQLSGEFDLAFIDGAHDRDSVRNDIQWALRFLDANGVIAFHDYKRPGDEGVTQAVNDFLAGGSVLLAVHDTLAVVKPAVTLV